MCIGNGNFEVNFCVSNSNSWGAYVLVGVKFVAANSHAGLIGFDLVRMHVTDKVGVGKFSASRDLTRFDKKIVCVPSLVLVGDSSRETP